MYMIINPCLLWFICYILHSVSKVYVINKHTQSSLHCKQGSIILQFPVLYETESTISCQYVENNTPFVTIETRMKWRLCSTGATTT